MHRCILWRSNYLYYSKESISHKKLYWIKILYFLFPIRLGLHCFITLGLYCFRSKKRLHYFRGVEFVRQCAFLDGNMCCSIHALSLTFAVYQSQIWLVGFAALNLAIAEDYMACSRSAKRFERLYSILAI